MGNEFNKNKELVDYLYFISDGEYLKIGKTKHPKKRLANLQVGNPRELKIIGCFEVTDAIEENLCEHPETFFHTLLKDYRESGEWFDITSLFKFLLRAFYFQMVFPNFNEIYAMGPNDAAKCFKEYNEFDESEKVLERFAALKYKEQFEKVE